MATAEVLNDILKKVVVSNRRVTRKGHPHLLNGRIIRLGSYFMVVGVESGGCGLLLWLRVRL